MLTFSEVLINIHIGCFTTLIIMLCVDGLLSLLEATLDWAHFWGGSHDHRHYQPAPSQQIQFRLNMVRGERPVLVYCALSCHRIVR